jgi:hypothetical protein
VRAALGVGAALIVAGGALLAMRALGMLDALPVYVGGIALLLGLGAIFYGFAMERRAVAEREASIAAEREREKIESTQTIGQLERAKSEADQILGAVRAHLMVVDSSLRIQTRYSSELEEVFKQRSLANENLLNVLRRLLSERMFQAARDYLNLLFDPTKKERTVLKVNPLDEVEITSGEGDNAQVRTLSFAFRRIMDGPTISRALVSVEDITDRAMRERQLRESEAQKVKQFELLIGILHVEPRQLDGFVATALEQLRAIDDALKVTDFSSATIGQTALLRQRLDTVLRLVHNIKGNASLLRLDYFESKSQAYETRVLDFKNRPALGGDDFLAIVIEQAAFRADLDELQALRVKLAGIQRAQAMRAEVGDDLVVSIGQLAKSLGAKLGKEVELDADGFDTRRLSPERRLAVKDVLIQLTRNSMVHGIEDPITREAAGKARGGTLELFMNTDAPEGSFAFTFRDDGRGLDPAKIRAKAVEHGLLSPDRAKAIDDSEIAGFIFAPAFSTAEDATVDAGRGMGMNVIKQRVVDECGGEISVNSEVGKFCEFSFVFPAQTPELVRA